MRQLGVIFFGLWSTLAFAENNVLNVYTWAQELSEEIIQQFEKETGIKVNYSTYDSNEILYAKLKASQTAQYDLIEPSGYYVTRMAREGMIEKIDLSALSNYKNLNENFMHPEYDPTGEYSIPWVWGLTGIFVNRQHYPADKNKIENWSDLWSEVYRGALLLLDDPREVFNIGLLTLGYSPNDQNLSDLEKAYKKLVTLLPNVKIYNNTSVVSMIIDEDVNIGMAWNADVYRASLENPAVEFIYPKDGYVMWVDAFAIPKGAPHRENAYKFLNFILQGKMAALQVKSSYYPTANREAMAHLPSELTNNKIVFPDEAIIKKGHFQTDVNDSALEAISKYWQLLKIH